jgi:hypothetical protein
VWEVRKRLARLQETGAELDKTTSPDVKSYLREKPGQAGIES